MPQLLFTSGIDRRPATAIEPGSPVERALRRRSRAASLIGHHATSRPTIQRREDLAPLDASGPIELLILQGSPFCNIDCRYCYLPSRSDRRRMSEAVLEASFKHLFASKHFNGRATVVWHAGEPLAVPLAFYRRAYEIMRPLVPPRAQIVWNFQTNATLIDDAWIDFFDEIHAAVGVSIDGPEALHDAQRVTRSGKGTFAAAMKGIDLLKQRRRSFFCISVLTRRSLEFPDEMYLFFRKLGCFQVGFNIDEQDGVRGATSFAGASEAAYRRFMMRFWELCQRDGVPLGWVREFRRTLQMLATPIAPEPRAPLSQEARPFAIVSVDWEGNFSTFSPELLGTSPAAYGDLSLGNVLKTSFDDAVGHPMLQRLQADIHAGVDACRQSCEYFPFCGGGSPGNKIGENGTANSTTTAYCRFQYQQLVESVMASL